MGSPKVYDAANEIWRSRVYDVNTQLTLAGTESSNSCLEVQMNQCEGPLRTNLRRGVMFRYADSSELSVSYYRCSVCAYKEKQFQVTPSNTSEPKNRSLSQISRHF
jgi:hypothetical protein